MHVSSIARAVVSFRGLALILVAIVSSGCVSVKYYTPAPDTHQLDEISEFTGSATVTLINNQPNEEEQLYHKQSKYHANYRAWTDVAMQIVQRELETRGFTVQDDGDKTLSMSIIHVLTETGWTQIQTQVTMKAETGSGYNSDFIGRNHSVMAANLKRQADGAVMRAVAAMLSDPAIAAYLAE